jgi:hypothetical protein
MKHRTRKRRTASQRRPTSVPATARQRKSRWSTGKPVVRLIYRIGVTCIVDDLSLGPIKRWDEYKQLITKALPPESDVAFDEDYDYVILSDGVLHDPPEEEEQEAQ